jgi:hypothetical protein
MRPLIGYITTDHLPPRSETVSKYRVIQTEYRTLASLLKALGEILTLSGDLELAADVRAPNLVLYDYLAEQRPERASIRIPRQTVNRFSGGCSNDIGFAWNGRTFIAIVSEYDEGNTGSQKLLSAIKQRYALHEIRRQAKSRGYTVREQAKPDGSITLSLVHR